MPRPRVISAKNRPTTHVELSDGDWVNLKQKLDYGEASVLYDATYRSNMASPDPTTSREVRMAVFNTQRILLYVMEWSFIDDEHKPLPVNAENIRRLDSETANELHEAITAVEEATSRAEKERATPNVVAASVVPAPVSIDKSKDSSAAQLAGH